MPDILIRGMEMPTDSPVYLTVCPSGGVYVHTYERGYGALVKSQCRVIELPEHGDLIDKQAVFKALSEKFKSSDGFVSWTDAIDIVLRAQEIAPSNKEDAE
jgi:hypothetical protein